MKKATASILASSLVLLATLGVMLVNAGIGTSTYRVFYTNEAIVGNKNLDGDSTDDLIVLMADNTGAYTYIGEGVEPEIAGNYVMWHKNLTSPDLYIFKIGTSPAFMPIYYRTNGTDHELHGSGIAYNTNESNVGQILNGDGDTTDKAVGYIDLTNFPTTYPATHWTGEKVQRGGYDGTYITYVKYEAQEAWPTDYNGDVDYIDSVVFYRQVSSINTESWPLRMTSPVSGCNGQQNQGTYPRVGGIAIVWTVDESKDSCDWNGLGGANDFIVAAFQITGPTTYAIDITKAAWEGHHYADNNWFVYEIDAWDNSVGSQSVYTNDWGTNKYYAFLGEPIKIVGNTIQGYVKESSVGMDLNNDGDTSDSAMWIHDKSTKQTEILQGGYRYWK